MKASSLLLKLLEQGVSPWHACGFLLKAIEETLPNLPLFASPRALAKKASLPSLGAIKSGEGDALVAWSLQGGQGREVTLLASHLDSPTMRLKPHGEIEEEGRLLWALEPYGSPILPSWFDHPLFLAGRVLLQEEGKEQLQELLVNLQHTPFTLPSLAIHLTRSQKEGAKEGLEPQKHLRGLTGGESLQEAIATALSKSATSFELVAHDLFASPAHPTILLGSSKGSTSPTLLQSARIDNLVSAAAMGEAFLSCALSNEPRNIIAIWTSHEEIGSTSSSGANSSFFSSLIRELLTSFDLGEACVFSIDGAHGRHPNWPELSEPLHAPLLGGGPVLKSNTQGRYRRDFVALKRLYERFGREGLQEFSMRSDLQCGSTVGPLLSAQLGLSCLDLGVAQLSMHAMREVCDLGDYEQLKELLIALS